MFEELKDNQKKESIITRFEISNLNDVLLKHLANDGNGNYAYVDDIDEARKLFVKDLISTLQVIALDAKIQVDFNLDVVAYYRLIGYENRDVCRRLLLRNCLDFRNDAIDAGEIGAGHSATVQLRWENPDPPQSDRDQRQLQHLGC